VFQQLSALRFDTRGTTCLFARVGHTSPFCNI
jgi:hypothetical protein